MKENLNLEIALNLWIQVFIMTFLSILKWLYLLEKDIKENNILKNKWVKQNTCFNDGKKWNIKSDILKVIWNINKQNSKS